MPTSDTDTINTDTINADTANTEREPPASGPSPEQPSFGSDMPSASDKVQHDEPADAGIPAADAPPAPASESLCAAPGPLAAADDQQAVVELLPELPPPHPIQLVLWNEKVPASAGCWVFWREAGFECRGKIEKGLFTATCKGYGGSTQSVPLELLLQRRFVSQGEAIAVMDAMLAFDPREAESLGFDITGQAMLSFLPASDTLNEA